MMLRVVGSISTKLGQTCIIINQPFSCPAIRTRLEI
jgi:hypothetical protein